MRDSPLSPGANQSRRDDVIDARILASEVRVALRRQAVLRGANARRSFTRETRVLPVQRIEDRDAVDDLRDGWKTDRIPGGARGIKSRVVGPVEEELCRS